MEAWERQDRNIDVEDLIQRMPFTANNNVWVKKKFSNALTQRKERFRNRTRCICWKRTEQDREWDQKLKKDMEANPAWLKANTTRHLDDLTTAEHKALEAATFMSGKHEKRAGRRKLQGDAKVEKERKMREILAGGEKNDVGVSAAEDLQTPEQISESRLNESAQAKATKKAKNSSVAYSGPPGVASSDDSVQQHFNAVLGLML